MKLTAKDLKFTLTGTLNPRGTTAYHRLRELGEEVSFSGKTQVLIHEQGRSTKPAKAAKLGIPVINEKQLITLVEKGELQVGSALDEVEGEKVLDELLGETRTWLARPRDAESWDNLCALVEQCHPEQQEPLIAHINGNLSRWEIDDQLRCKAPHDWLLQMIDGQNLPKFALVRALDFGGDGYTGTKVLNALKNNATLTHLRSLNMHVNKGLSKTLMSAISTLPSCENLVEIGFGSVAPDHLAALDVTGEITRFIWCANHFYNDASHDELAALWERPFMAQVTRFAWDAGTLLKLTYAARTTPQHVEHMSAIAHHDVSRAPGYHTDALQGLLDLVSPAELTIALEHRTGFTARENLHYNDALRTLTLLNPTPSSGLSSKTLLDRLKRLNLPSAQKLERVHVRGYDRPRLCELLTAQHPALTID